MKQIKIGTFNAYNLVLPNTTYYGWKKYTSDEYRKKISWMGWQLDTMKADIIGFQEVFHRTALEEVLDSSLYCKDYHIVMSKPSSTVTSPDLAPIVALATKFPVLDYHVVEDFNEMLLLDTEVSVPIFQFSRPVLIVELEMYGQAVTVFVVHLKSKRPDIAKGADADDPMEQAKGQARSLIRRAAEATALRSLLLQYLNKRSYPVILLGDVNDSGSAVTTDILAGQEPMSYWHKEKKMKYWDVLLYNVKNIQALKSYQDYYYTHIHNGHHESLDHILVSQEFVRENPNHIGEVRYVQVLNDHLQDNTLSREGVEGWQSDHAQVVATIEFE
ncbi:MAG: hypothetical protein R3E32_03095 [Chitinophagales bacterium]